jgi:OOP family OmpA-OmpF porin
VKHLASAALVMLMCLSTGIAHADAPPNYFGLMGSYIFTDSARKTDDGAGWHVLYGSPVNRWLSVELNAFGQRAQLETIDEYDYAYGGGIDLRSMFAGSNRFGAFLLTGVGAVWEDYVNEEEISPYLNAGVGMLAGWSQFQFRLEGRYYATFNSEQYPGNSVLYDPRVNLGVQFSFGPGRVAVVDSDGDGVTDDRDACPNTPRGLSVDANGCPLSLDDDNDGVPNAQDACPMTPAGTLVDPSGCPVVVPPVSLDADNDGVLDSEDRCPGTPPGFRVDIHGCIVKEQTVVVLDSVAFEFDSAKLTHAARAALDRVYDGLSQQADISVEIGGHTDSLGSQSYNLNLSQQRATTVRNFLIARGFDASRLRAEGYGEFNPIADNNTEEGRAQNRRVEFKILTK